VNEGPTKKLPSPPQNSRLAKSAISVPIRHLQGIVAHTVGQPALPTPTKKLVIL
jgi:hypothetical protein